MKLTVVHVAGPISVQGAPRHGRMHEGVPPGGALLPSLLASANRAAGNRDDAPAVELLGRLVVRADDGTETTLESPVWTYAVVPGGQDAPPLVTTHLRKGDVLRGPLTLVDAPPSAEERVRVIAGPDADAFAPDALATLCAATYEVFVRDRTGARLRGPALVRTGAREVTRPMVRGAIEVARDGMPIVLGPDHPTTGGYPILAVVADADVERVFAGARVRFVVA
ncbi:MAG: allophanate hydrolase subunit 2 family protein [Deltaproteobacteria bacterium]|nr:allophanate hydrolase subunit 2 family protein [Deltaproteobacteria bacterium]